MERKDLTILVVGATGHQGGAAARHLLEDGWHVRALAHHPDAPEARALREQGVELVPGDLLDRDSLNSAVEGVYGIFSMQTPAGVGFEAEEQEGKNIANAAKAAGVEHFVYSSTEGADRDAGPGWIRSKHHIEEYIHELDLPATVWRPVTFMENYLGQRDEILAGTLKSPAWPETMAYLIAVDDIGRFVALAFRRPETYLGKTMEIAGDSMTMLDVAQTFSEVLEIPIEFEHVEHPNAPPPPRPEPGEIQRVRADIAECRRMLPDLATLGTWIEATGWKARVRR